MAYACLAPAHEKSITENTTGQTITNTKSTTTEIAMVLIKYLTLRLIQHSQPNDYEHFFHFSCIDATSAMEKSVIESVYRIFFNPHESYETYEIKWDTLFNL